MEEKMFYRLLREICKEKGIDMEVMSYGWIVQLSKDGKVRHIAGRRFDLNSEASGNIACDKYATYEVLKSQSIPVIEHTMVFNPATRVDFVKEEGIWIKIISEFLKYSKLVIKPNYGSEGQGVFLCGNIKEVEAAIQKLFKTQNSISICPYYKIKTEYRTFYLDGEIKLIYGKTKPYVIGDGKNSLANLIEDLNLPDKKVVAENLKEIDMEHIPNIGEKIEISWKHNLSGGAIPKILEKGELYHEIEKLAIIAGNAMNMRFATIDIIQTEDGKLYVLEVNSGIGTTIFSETIEGGVEIIKDIYRQAIEKLFS